MLLLLLLALPSLPGLGAAQRAGTVTTERHPKLAWKHCISPGTCLTLEGELTIDSNWRWTYDRETYDDCYSPSSGWNSAVCTDGRGCADRCALDGVDNYAERFGVFTCRDSVMLEFTNAGDEGVFTSLHQVETTLTTKAVNIGSRMYLMATPTKYQTFSLLGNELTFDVDTSRLGYVMSRHSYRSRADKRPNRCGMNGALYFVAMDEDGGMAKYPGNKAGAKYGTGYCDARCPRGDRFVNGEANLGSQSVGAGRYGSCCAEIDVWYVRLHTMLDFRCCWDTVLTG
jgi:cellulose 1,4-beta-cellobiosidase